MNYSQMQQQLKINSELIYSIELDMAISKNHAAYLKGRMECEKGAPRADINDRREVLFNTIGIQKKRLARIVALQKQLKADMWTSTYQQRIGYCYGCGC